MPVFNKPNDINKRWADSGTRLTPDDNKISLGWVVEAPPYQEMNYIHYKQDSALAHINQHGLPVWDSVTEYIGGVSWTLASNGNVYACKVTNTNQNPVTDVSESYWKPILDRNSVISITQTTPYTRDFLTSSDASNARNKLGITSVGSNIITSPSQSDARSAIGATSLGSSLITATSGLNARTSLGITPTGNNVITANSQSEARSAIGISPAGSNLVSLSSTSDMRSYLGLLQGFTSNATGVGHIKLPDIYGGFIIQWNNSQAVAANSTASAVKSIPFPNAALAVTCSPNWPGQVDIATPHAYVSGTNIVLVNTDNDPIGISWIAIGY